MPSCIRIQRYIVNSTISGYPPRDLLERRDFVGANLSHLQRLVDSVTGIGVICGFVDENPAEEGNSLHNSAVLFDRGKILHQVHKRLLPDYDVFDERRYFEPGTVWSCFPYKGATIGLTICEDIWNDSDFFPRAFSRRLYTVDPVEGMINVSGPAASGWAVPSSMALLRQWGRARVRQRRRGPARAGPRVFRLASRCASSPPGKRQMLRAKTDWGSNASEDAAEAETRGGGRWLPPRMLPSLSAWSLRLLAGGIQLAQSWATVLG